MGVLRGVAEERVEVLDGVKKPPYQAVENSLTGATTQTLTDAHWPMGLHRVIVYIQSTFLAFCVSNFPVGYAHRQFTCALTMICFRNVNVAFVSALH